MIRLCYLFRKHDIDPKHRTPARNHVKFPEDPAALKPPTAIKKPLNYVNGMNKKIVKMRRIDELPSAPMPSVQVSSGIGKHYSSSNLMNKRRKVPVSVVMEKPVVMSKIPFSSFPEIDRYTEMRQAYPTVFHFLSLRSLYSLSFSTRLRCFNE